MPSYSHSIVPYLASGAIHLSAAGLVWIGLGWGGYVPPAFDVRWGEMDSAISSAWAPEARAPFDDGPLVSVLGDEHVKEPHDEALLVTTAVEVIRQQEATKLDVAQPQASPKRIEPIDAQQQLDQRYQALALPERLDEPVFEQPLTVAKSEQRTSATADAPPTPESLDRPIEQSRVALLTPAPPKRITATAALPMPNEPPLPDDVPDRPQPPAPKPPTAEGTRPLAAAPTGNAQPMVAAGAQAGAENSPKRMGNADGTAVKGQSSSASAAMAASELPPGARPDQPPSKLPTNPSPKYPAEAYQRGEEGDVMLLVSVSAEGRVRQVRLDKSSGFKLLDDAALSTVRAWQFQPATYRGQPVGTWVRVPIRFSLADGM